MNPININAGLALAAALLIVGTFNHMDKNTNTAVRLAALMVFAGLLAQGLGVFFKSWDHYADTLICSGIAALMIANRRTPCGIPAKYIQKISVGIVISAAFYTFIMWGRA